MYKYLKEREHTAFSEVQVVWEDRIFNPGKGLGISKNKVKERKQVRNHKGICCFCKSESHWQTIEIDPGSHKKKIYFGKLLDRSNVFPTNSIHWWVS